jgi:hypothetical protein
LDEIETFRKRENINLGHVYQFGVSAAEPIATDDLVARAEIISALQATEALPAAPPGRDHHGIPHSDAGAEFTNGGHLAADVTARDVGKRYLDAGEPLAKPEVQVVQGARLNPHQDLVRGDLGVRDLLLLQNLASPMRVKIVSFL